MKYRYIYTIEAHTNDHMRITLIIKANSEKEALKKAKQLISRETYVVRRIIERI